MNELFIDRSFFRKNTSTSYKGMKWMLEKTSIIKLWNYLIKLKLTERLMFALILANGRCQFSIHFRVET